MRLSRNVSTSTDYRQWQGCIIDTPLHFYHEQNSGGQEGQDYAYNKEDYHKRSGMHTAKGVGVRVETILLTQSSSLRDVLIREDKTMQGFVGTYAIYFHSRKRMADTSTWGKEKMPSDYTEQEVAEAARIAGCEGYAIVENNQVKTMKWFKN
jgi:hypothetical protein